MLCDQYFHSDMCCFVRGWYQYSACNLYFWKLSTLSQIPLFVTLVPIFWVLNGCESTVLRHHHRQQKTLFELCKEIRQINVYPTGIFKDKRRHERTLCPKKLYIYFFVICRILIGHYRNVRGLGKSMTVFRLFEKLRYSNKRSTIF